MSDPHRRGRLSPLLLSILYILVAFAILTGVIFLAAMPDRYDLRAGQVSNVTITATKDVVDTVTTNSLRDAAAKAVSPSYKPDPKVADRVLTDSAEALAKLVPLGCAENAVAPDEVSVSMERSAKSLFTPVELTNEQLLAVLHTPQSELQAAVDEALDRLGELLNLNISQGQEEESLTGIRKDLVSSGYEEQLADTVIAILRPYMQANMIIDEETTSANRAKAREEIEDVVYIKGQNIVRSGEVITRAQITMLNSLGLSQEQGLDIMLLAGASAMVAVLLSLMVLYLGAFENNLLFHPGQILLLMGILVMTVLACWGASFLNAYLMPTAAGVMLICLLMRRRLALMSCVLISIFAGLMASGSSGILTASAFTVLLTSLISGSMAIMVISHNRTRTGIMISGLLCALFSMIGSVAVGLMNNAVLNSVLLSACWAGGSGIVSAMLAMALQPVLESLFNLPTRSKLFELSNPNRPLLKRLLIEAPGTYHHSIMVANLAESAANAIGANGLLCRVGAYYHDVGKLRRPLFFSENQIGDNPHDRADPRVSAAIILAHPHDGLELATKEHLPQAVLNIIERHHGHTMAAFFYAKAVNTDGEENVNKGDFTYDTPLPRTREETVVMLADPVEAAARALPSKDRASLTALIEKLVSARIENGDLAECELTLAEISEIKHQFITVLMGMYHERVEYPEANKPKKSDDKPHGKHAASLIARVATGAHKPAAKDVQAPATEAIQTAETADGRGPAPEPETSGEHEPKHAAQPGTEKENEE